MTDPALIESVEAVLDLNVADISTWEIERTALAVLTAVAPLIRAAALEEAAKVAENQPSAPLKIGAPQTWMKQQIAAAIRSLKEQP